MSLSVRERAEGFLASTVAVAPSLQSERAEGVLPLSSTEATASHSERAADVLASAVAVTTRFHSEQVAVLFPKSTVPLDNEAGAAAPVVDTRRTHLRARLGSHAGM